MDTEGIFMKKNRNDNRLKKTIRYFKSNHWTYALLCFLLVAAALLIQFFRHLGDESYGIGDYFASLIEVKTFLSIVLAFVLTGIAYSIANVFDGKIEDYMKLTNDYDHLSKKYGTFNKLLVYKNASDSPFLIGRKKSGCVPKSKKNNEDEYVFPTIVVSSLYDKKTKIQFEFGEKTYRLPPWASKHSDELLAAHAHSKIYNQQALRADDFTVEGNQATIFLSHTSYFDSLVTNRACDYDVNGASIREIYEPGPFLHELKDSQLSNHLGFNGMVETADHKFIFIKRHRRVSIAKNTLQSSVGASLKVKYALTADHKVTPESISLAIVKEIMDEFCLDRLQNHRELEEQIRNDFSFQKNVLFFYRELLESGKPQLMFYYRLPIESNEVIRAFTKGTKFLKKQKRHNLFLSVDGYKMLLVDAKDLSKIYLCPDGMVIGKKFYKSVPGAVATVIMLLQYLKEKNAGRSNGKRRETLQK